MDGVEIVMLTEERFGIEIADSEAETIRTPGMLIELVLKKVELAPAKVCQSQRSFYLLRRALMKLVNVERSKIRPDTIVRHYATHEKEVEFWPALGAAVGARSWPSLDFSSQADLAFKAVVIGTWLCVWILLWFLLKKSIDSISAGTYSFFAGLVAAGLTGALIKSMGKPFQNFIPQRFQTLSDLIPFVSTSNEIKWTRDDVARAVRDIVEEVLASGDKYREEADFVKDLGLG